MFNYYDDQYYGRTGWITELDSGEFGWTCLNPEHAWINLRGFSDPGLKFYADADASEGVARFRHPMMRITSGLLFFSLDAKWIAYEADSGACSDEGMRFVAVNPLTSEAEVIAQVNVSRTATTWTVTMTTGDPDDPQASKSMSWAAGTTTQIHICLMVNLDRRRATMLVGRPKSFVGLTAPPTTDGLLGKFYQSWIETGESDESVLDGSIPLPPDATHVDAAELYVGCAPFTGTNSFPLIFVNHMIITPYGIPAIGDQTCNVLGKLANFEGEGLYPVIPFGVGPTVQINTATIFSEGKTVCRVDETSSGSHPPAIAANGPLAAILGMGCPHVIVACGTNDIGQDRMSFAPIYFKYDGGKTATWKVDTGAKLIRFTFNGVNHDLTYDATTHWGTSGTVWALMNACHAAEPEFQAYDYGDQEVPVTRYTYRRHWAYRPLDGEIVAQTQATIPNGSPTYGYLYNRDYRMMQTLQDSLLGIAAQIKAAGSMALFVNGVPRGASGLTQFYRTAYATADMLQFNAFVTAMGEAGLCKSFDLYSLLDDGNDHYANALCSYNSYGIWFESSDGDGYNAIKAAVWDDWRAALNELTGSANPAPTIGQAHPIVSVVDSAPVDLAQTVDQGQLTGTLGEILELLRSLAGGRQVLDKTAKTLTRYAADGTTPLVTLDVDDVEDPTEVSP